MHDLLQFFNKRKMSIAMRHNTATIFLWSFMSTKRDFYPMKEIQQRVCSKQCIIYIFNEI